MAFEVRRTTADYPSGAPSSTPFARDAGPQAALSYGSFADRGPIIICDPPLSGRGEEVDPFLSSAYGLDLAYRPIYYEQPNRKFTWSLSDTARVDRTRLNTLLNEDMRWVQERQSTVLSVLYRDALSILILEGLQEEIQKDLLEDCFAADRPSLEGHLKTITDLLDNIRSYQRWCCVHGIVELFKCCIKGCASCFCEPSESSGSGGRRSYDPVTRTVQYREYNSSWQSRYHYVSGPGGHPGRYVYR